MSAPPRPGEPEEDNVETYSALANATKLASSLVLSFGITLVVRQLLIPRLLGTERFGELNYADGFAGVFLTATWLGVDTWFRKELGVTLKNADGIFGGVIVVRSAFTVVLTAAMAVTLHQLGRPREIVLTACVFGVAQLMTMMMNSASALLHAAGKVGGLSVVNIAGKLLWAGIVLPTLLLKLSIVWLAVAFAVSEGVKAFAATLLARRYTGLRMTPDLKATLKALRASMPFWVNNIALAGVGRADVAVLGTVAVGLLGTEAAANREVGWYTVVIGFGSMLMVIAPVVGWVLMPLLSRAIQKGEDEASPIVRRAVEACIVLGMPISVGAFVAADEILALFYKPEYAPAGITLKIMAATYVLTYLNVVAANCLAAMNRGWTVTLTSLTTLVLVPLLCFFFVPPALARFGPSGGAASCALAVVVAEVFTTSIMLRRLGRMAVDGRLISVCVRTAFTAGAVIGLDAFLSREPLHPWLRIAVDAAAYVAIALTTRSVRISEAVAFVKLARAQRAARAGAAPA